MTDDVRISTGNSALDDVLRGGLDAGRLYLIEGMPGTGKTTLALQFLLANDSPTPALYVALSETKQELQLIMGRHGWTPKNLELFELIPAEARLDSGAEVTVLHPAEIELSETLDHVFDKVNELKPTRVVIDSLSELRLLAQTSTRYRRQILALKHFFAKQKATVLLLDDMSTASGDVQLHSIAHGVISLEQLAIDYGAERRRLRVVKMRGISFRSGYHDFTIKTGGIEIYPRLIAAEHHVPFASHTISSGNPELDALLGGLENGTNMLILGSSGVGKSSIGLAYALEAARRGQRSAYFAFDEVRATLLVRARTLGMPLDQALEDGMITHRQIDPAELSPGEFTSVVRKAVEQDHAKIVVIDSLNGFMNSMPDERFLLLQMHELLSYLGQQGVFTIVILAQHGLVGPAQSPIDLSYLSDTVLMLRYFEAGGSVHRAISVVKKRTGAHEGTIREFKLDSEGLHVGPPLKDFAGIFAGTPQYTGDTLPAMELS